MKSVASYLEEKIKLAMAFYEDRLSRIDQNYLAGIERLAKRTKDPILADFFRTTMTPARISSALANIRFRLSQGQIVDADMALERLKREIDAVEAHLRTPVLRAGIATARGGSKSAFLKHGSNLPTVYTNMREQYGEQRKLGKSKGDAEKYVARKHRVSTRTVRKARSGK